jgi:hypothetical protein
MDMAAIARDRGNNATPLLSFSRVLAALPKAGNQGEKSLSTRAQLISKLLFHRSGSNAAGNGLLSENCKPVHRLVDVQGNPGMPHCALGDRTPRAQ